MAATLSATNVIQEPQGLSSEAVRRLLKQYGPNEPAPACQYSLILGLLRLFVNPLAIILLIAAGSSMILGQIVDATIIIVMVVLGIALNFVQTYRSQRAIEALRQRVSTTASVLRDGSWQEVPRAEIVLGDLSGLP